jgi:hypothetical protein
LLGLFALAFLFAFGLQFLLELLFAFAVVCFARAKEK